LELFFPFRIHSISYEILNSGLMVVERVLECALT
jgi:hypothetical protein